ncbi:MAG: radical SAM protein [Nitrospira sp.]
MAEPDRRGHLRCGPTFSNSTKPLPIFLLQLYTNGTLFTPAIVERLRAQPPFSIDISCHSADEVQFDWFTQVPGSYRAFRRGLDLLQGSGVPFTLKTKLMNWNADDWIRLKAFIGESYGQPFGYDLALSPIERVIARRCTIASPLTPRALSNQPTSRARRIDAEPPRRCRVRPMIVSSAHAGPTQSTSTPGAN